MKIRANQLSSHLQKSLAPCYLVTGDEPLLVAEALDDIREAARARGFTSRELHVATTGFDWAQLTASTGNMSLFAEQRIVELRLDGRLVERGEDRMMAILHHKLRMRDHAANPVNRDLGLLGSRIG